MPHWLKFVLLFLVLLLISSIPLARQFESSAIQGFVTDQNGPVAGASIEAREAISGLTFRAETGASGWYQIERMKAGRYSLDVHAPGHDSLWIARVIVAPGQVVHEDVFLSRHSFSVGL